MLGPVVTGDAIFRYRQWTLEGRLRPGGDEAPLRIRGVVDHDEDRIKGDEERWTAYLGGDDLDEAARDCLLLPGMRGARVR